MGRWETFAALPPPSGPGRYTAEPGGQPFRVAKSFDSYPAILVRFDGGEGRSTARRLVNIAYEPPSRIDLVAGDGHRTTERLAILECRATEPQLGAYFFRIVEAVFFHADAILEEEQFETALDSLMTLFRALQRPGLRSLEGLWAELAIIAWSNEPAAALSSWHSSPRALHDFSGGNHRLEVKATQKPLREHGFLLDQLASFNSGITLVASIMLREAEGGDSVFDLVEKIKARLGGASEPARRLEVIVAESLGEGWRDATEIRFSLRHARRGLHVYAAEQVPTIPQPLPLEIKEVRFIVDLSDVVPLMAEAARSIGPLFQLLVPPDEPDV